MNRVKVPSQSKQSLENVFDNLQDYIKTNIDKRIAILFNNFGIKSLINGTDLQVTPTSGSGINVATGVGITNSYEIIKLDTITAFDLNNAVLSSNGQAAVIANNVIYVVKLYWILDGSLPISVANSFNYNAETTLPEEQRYSKYSDGVVLSVEAITSGNLPTANNNELMLAVVKTDGSGNIDNSFASFDTGIEVITAVNGICDIRHLNLLLQGDIKINDNNSLETHSITPSGNGGLIIKSDNDLPTNFKTALDESIMKVDNINKKVIMGTDTATDALDITGVIRATGDIYSNGWKVLTEEIYEIKNILNFRIKSLDGITGANPTNHKDSSLTVGDFPIDNELADDLNLYLKWGYDSIEGTGSTTGGSFTITAGGKAGGFLDDELIGQYLYIPGVANYYIADNIGNILILHDGYQTVATNIPNATSGNKAQINSNVTSYEVVAVPYVSGAGEDDDDLEGEIINYSNDTTVSTVLMKKKLRLESGVKYNTKIRGIRGDVKGPWTPLGNYEEGSYTRFGVTAYYGVGTHNSGYAAGDVLMKHVALSGTDHSLNIVSTASGFKLTLNPGVSSWNWSYAEEYEFAWSDAGTTINWSDKSTYESKITAKYSVSIATYDSLEYNVSVRPLIGRMVVGTPLTGTVVSGTGGALPANNIIATTKVEHYTFSASSYLDYDPATDHLEFTGNIYSPSESTNITSYSALRPGYIITIQTKNYRLARKITDTKWKIESIDGVSTPPLDGSGVAFEIGTSERARQVYTSVLQADTQVTKIEAVCDIHEGEDVMVRVYQGASNRDAFADYCIVSGDVEGPTGSGQTFSSAADHLILSSYGTRTLVIDLWDNKTEPDSNDGSFVGTINIYGQTYTATAYDKITSTT